MKRIRNGSARKNLFRSCAVLIAMLLIPAVLFSQKSDTITRIIHGHTYRFISDTIDPSVVGFRLINENDSVLLDLYAVIAGGDCNYHMNEASGYELESDHLFLYIYKHDSDSYDKFPGVVSYIALKEEYIFQKSGKLVRVGFVSGGPETPVWEEVNVKIAKQILLAEAE